MISHVAQQGEQRGRVVLQLRTSHPNPVAVEAAFRIAQAFQSEVESLFVENAQLFELAGFPFAREVSLTGRETRALRPESIERDLRLQLAGIRRRIEDLARTSAVPMRLRVVRDEPVHALEAACAECGPWNVVALADPFSIGNGHELCELLDRVTGATGLVLVGPKARRTSGPVVVAVEDVEHLPAMVRTAERLTGPIGGALVLLLIAENETEARTTEAQARLLLGASTTARIEVASAVHGAPAVAAEAIRRLSAGFVVGRLGGLLVPREGDLRHLSAALECPLFLMR